MRKLFLSLFLCAVAQSLVAMESPVLGEVAAAAVATAPVDVCDDWLGMNALHNAAYAGDQARVQALLEAGVNVNAPVLAGTLPNPMEGYTALHIAVWKEDEVVIGLLLEHDAEVNALSKRGHTPMDLAVMIDAKIIMIILTAHGGTWNKHVLDSQREISDLSWRSVCGARVTEPLF